MFLYNCSFCMRGSHCWSFTAAVLREKSGSVALYSSCLKLNLAQISSHIALLFSVNTPTASVMLSILLSFHFFLLFSAIHTVCNSDTYLSLSPWSQHDTQFATHFTSAKKCAILFFVLYCVFQFNTILIAFCLHFILCMYFNIQSLYDRWFGDISQKGSNL